MISGYANLPKFLSDIIPAVSDVQLIEAEVKNGFYLMSSQIVHKPYIYEMANSVGNDSQSVILTGAPTFTTQEGNSNISLTLSSNALFSETLLIALLKFESDSSNPDKIIVSFVSKTVQ